jgi:hypothetical protein
MPGPIRRLANGPTRIKFGSEVSEYLLSHKTEIEKNFGEGDLVGATRKRYEIAKASPYAQAKEPEKARLFICLFIYLFVMTACSPEAMPFRKQIQWYTGKQEIPNRKKRGSLIGCDATAAARHHNSPQLPSFSIRCLGTVN